MRETRRNDRLLILIAFSLVFSFFRFSFSSSSFYQQKEENE
jgi:hypothetical protein